MDHYGCDYPEDHLGGESRDTCVFFSPPFDCHVQNTKYISLQRHSVGEAIIELWQINKTNLFITLSEHFGSKDHGKSGCSA
jgi:hypothetical protein